MLLCLHEGLSHNTQLMQVNVVSIKCYACSYLCASGTVGATPLVWAVSWGEDLGPTPILKSEKLLVTEVLKRKSSHSYRGKSAKNSKSDASRLKLTSCRQWRRAGISARRGDHPGWIPQIQRELLRNPSRQIRVCSEGWKEYMRYTYSCSQWIDLSNHWIYNYQPSEFHTSTVHKRHA